MMACGGAIDNVWSEGSIDQIGDPLRRTQRLIAIAQLTAEITPDDVSESAELPPNASTASHFISAESNNSHRIHSIYLWTCESSIHETLTMLLPK